MCPPYRVNNSEPYIIEADSIGELNSLFKCRMEEVLVQSISKPSISQPLTIKLEDELIEPLSSDSGNGTHVIDGSSVEDLDQQFAQLSDEALASATSNPRCHNESIQEKSSEALPAGNGYYSEIHHEESPPEVTLEPSVLTVKKSTTDSLPLHTDQPGCFSVVHVLEESSVKDITMELGEVHDQVETHGSSVPAIKHDDCSSCELHILASGLIENEPCLVTQLDRESQVKTISNAALYTPTAMEPEGDTSNSSLSADGELGVVQASSVEEMNSVLEKVQEEVLRNKH